MPPTQRDNAQVSIRLEPELSIFQFAAHTMFHEFFVDYLVNNTILAFVRLNSRRQTVIKEIMGRVSDARERLMKAVMELIWVGSYGSTTIDQICDKAGVKKGSFYYFFNSKAEVAEAALEAEWELRRDELDRIFSPTVPPLERLRRYCEYSNQFQREMRKKCGCVLGCPLFSIGAEVSTREDNLQKKVKEILEQKRKYLESAIRDAQAQGSVAEGDPAQKARCLFAYYQGLTTQARIDNDLDELAGAMRGTWDLLGVTEDQVA